MFGLVLTAHAALLLVWRPGPQLSRPGESTVEPTPLVVRLVVPAPKPPPEASMATSPANVQRVASKRPTPSAAQSAAPSAAPTAVSVSAAPLVEIPSSVDRPASTAIGESPLNLRLSLPRGMAERGVLTEPPNGARRQALNDPRANSRPDPSQQLPNDVAAAGKGDCIKGDYAGAGMGLLSLPFLAYAAAAGNCKPQR